MPVGKGRFRFAGHRKAASLYVGMFGLLVASFIPGTAVAAAGDSCSSTLYSTDSSGNRTFRVSWTSANQNEEYVIRRQVGGSGSWYWRGRSAGTSWVDETPDASNGQDVRYRVNRRGTSNYVYCSTAVDSERPTVPYKPVLAEPSDTSVTLTLKHKGDNVSVNGFKLYRNTVNSFAGAAETEIIEPNAAAEISFVDTNVEAETKYFYWLKVFDAAGNTSYRSGALEVTTDQSPLPVPATPEPPTVTPANVQQLSLEWAEVPYAASYNVYRDISDGAVSPSPVATGVVETTWTDPKIFPTGSIHTYRIQAVNESGSSPISDKSSGVAVTGDCDTANATGRWRTAELCGIWKIVGPDGQAEEWNAVNVRGHSLANHPLDATDVSRLAERFDTVRLTLKWDQLQPTDGPLPNNAHVVAAKAFLDEAQSQNIDVVLDFAHLGGGSEFGMPDWAWDQAGITQNRAPNRSYPVWAGTDHSGGPLKGYIDELEAAGLLTHPAVIAVEAVNEPHPPQGVGATTHAGQQALANTYAELTNHIRTYDPEMLVVLGAYYGGTRHGGVRSGDSFSFNHARSELTDQGIENIVWTAHNYYTGVGDQDGENDGQSAAGARGVGLWAEGYASNGCYSDTTTQSASTPWVCPPVPVNQPQARAGHLGNAKGHFDYAQEASMPFFMGEWGLPRQRYQSGEYRGWGGSAALFCDKVEAYADVDGEGNAISWAVWSFDADADAFGIYNSRNNPSHQDSAKKYLPPNTWVDEGVFPNDSSQASWQRQSWQYIGGWPNAGC